MHRCRKGFTQPKVFRGCAAQVNPGKSREIQGNPGTEAPPNRWSVAILRHDPQCFTERTGGTGFLKSRAYRLPKDCPVRGTDGYAGGGARRRSGPVLAIRSKRSSRAPRRGGGLAALLFVPRGRWARLAMRFGGIRMSKNGRGTGRGSHKGTKAQRHEAELELRVSEGNGRHRPRRRAD